MTKVTETANEAVPGETGFQITIETNSPEDLPCDQQRTIKSNAHTFSPCRKKASETFA
jgi:hypothetical protein